MTTWVFGSSSDLSKEVIKNLDNPICFGRHNVDYSDPEAFIDTHLNSYIAEDSSPLNIYVNIPITHEIFDHKSNVPDNCVVCRSNPIYKNECIDADANSPKDSPRQCMIRSVKSFNLSLADMSTNVYFFYRLLSVTNLLKKSVNVCYITSSIGNSHRYDSVQGHRKFKENNTSVPPSYFLYATARAMQQFSFIAHDNEFCRTVGVSPSNLSEESIPVYAKEIAKLLYTDTDSPQWGKVHDLSNGVWYVCENYFIPS